MKRKSLAIEKTIIIILSILLLVLGIVIIYRLYQFGSINIERVNKTINETLNKTLK
ncbi:MAG: hypothetical protein QW038_01925 [Nanopusillaceae archaeon]